MELILLFMKRHPSIRVELYTIKDCVVVSLKLTTFRATRIIEADQLTSKVYMSYYLPIMLEDMARNLYKEVDE